MKKRTIHIYTDGSVIATGGGWAVRMISIEGGLEVTNLRRDRQGEVDGVVTDPQEAEMIAMIAGLEMIADKGVEATVFTDAKHMIQQWHSYKDNRRPPFLELWIHIERLVNEKRIKFAIKYVKGHNGNEHNESCDRRAKRAALRALKRREVNN